MKTTLTKLTNIIGFIFLISLLGCKNYEPDSMNLGEVKMANEEQTLLKNRASEQENLVNRKLIKNGNVEFESENLNKTRENIFKVVKKYNAYLAFDNEYKTTNEISNSLNI